MEGYRYVYITQICGAISQYNNTVMSGPKNYLQLLVKQAKMEGFVVFNFVKRFSTAIRDYSVWLKEGKITYRVCNTFSLTLGTYC